jgi:hypothetical protein
MNVCEFVEKKRDIIFLWMCSVKVCETVTVTVCFVHSTDGGVTEVALCALSSLLCVFYDDL